MLLVASIVESVVPLFPLFTDGRLFREMNFFGGLTQGFDFDCEFKEVDW